MTPAHFSRRTLVLAVVAAGLLLALIAHVDGGGGGASTEEAGVRPEEGAGQRPTWGEPAADSLDEDLRAMADEPVPTPMIDEVAVDHPVACAETPVTVTIRARDPGGRDDQLIAGVEVRNAALADNPEYQPVPIPGNPVVVALSEPGDYVLRAHVAVPGRFDQADAPLSIRRCPQGTPLAIRAQPAGPATRIRFTAEATRAGAVPTAYHWDFGDGTSTATSAPEVEHDYIDTLAEQVRQSTFVVRVAARSTGKPPLAGTTSVAILHPYVDAQLQSDTVEPVVRAGGLRRDAGDLVLPLTVRHWEPDPLRITRVLGRAYPCGPPTPTAFDLSPQATLGSDQLPANVRTEARLSAALVPPGTCRVILFIDAETATGRTAEFQVIFPLGA